jgi:hypothetical protein
VLSLCEPTLAGSPHQIIAPDNANAIKLKALSGIDTADLVDALRIDRPRI